MNNDKEKNLLVMRTSPNGWLYLGSGMVIIITVWGWLLPWIAARPSVARQLHEYREAGIEADALFYTALPSAEASRQRILERLNEQPRD